MSREYYLKKVNSFFSNFDYLLILQALERDRNNLNIAIANNENVVEDENGCECLINII